MKLFNIFNEDWQTVRGYDRERYTELPGLEGPISTKSGKVLYYDKKEGKYYDRDTDMYLDHDEALAFLNEDFEAEFGFPLVEKENVATTGKTQRILTLMKARYPQAENDIEALLLHFDAGQERDRRDINRLGAENDAEEEEIVDLQKELDKIKARRAMGEAEGNKERAERAAMAKIQDQFKDMPKYKPQSAEERAKAYKEREAQAMEKAKQQANMLMQLADKHGENISASEVGYFAKGIADGKRGYSDPKAGDALGPNVYAYDAGVRVGEKLGESVNEDYYETDEQRELARLGRIIMDMGAKRDDDIGAAMGAVGMELTKYGTPQGVSSIQKLEKVTGQPESVIMKMMALAQKVQGDVAVGNDVPDEELEEGAVSDLKLSPEMQKRVKNASDEELRNIAFSSGDDSLRAGDDFEMLKKARAELQQNVAEADFDTNFKKRIGYTVKGGAASDMMKKQAAQAQANNPDAGTGLGPGVLNIEKARKKAKEKGVRAPGSLRASPNTRNPERLPEAESQMVSATLPNVLFDGARKLERLAKENGVEYSRQGRTVTLTGEKTNVKRIFYKMAYDPGNHPKLTPVNEAKDDIKIGDTVQTLKMGQMQGTVTGFSKKGGIDKVMFKHESGKTYATVPENLKVISSKKTESLDDTVVEAKKKPVPTDPSKWSYYKSQAKKKFDVYPSAYANAWAAKQYKAAGGGWRMGKPKK